VPAIPKLLRTYGAGMAPALPAHVRSIARYSRKNLLSRIKQAAGGNTLCLFLQKLFAAHQAGRLRFFSEHAPLAGINLHSASLARIFS